MKSLVPLPLPAKMGVKITMLFLILLGILSTTTKGLDRKSSSSTFTINVWDSGNVTEIANSSSSVVRGKMEISSSATTPVVPNYYLANTTSRSSSHSRSYSNVHSNQNRDRDNRNSNDKIPQSRNKPLLNALVNKLESLSSKLDRLGLVQVQIQKSFDSLESRYSLPPSGVDEVPQCGRRVDRVLRTLTPLVSRVEGLWNVVAGGSGGKLATGNLNLNQSPSQFLGAPPNDILLSESRRQERAITAIRSDLNVRSRQIISELGTVEHQLDLLQSNLNKIPTTSSSPTPVDPVDLVGGELPLNNNDVTLVADPGPIAANGTLRVPGLVFPSVRNKPSADISTVDGAEALLTGSGQTGVSCAELMQQGNRRSGLYHLRLPGARSSFWQLLAYCEQETAGGGWMVIQRRADFGEPRESFHRNWVEYRSGFGDPVKELWMGNLNLHLLTTSEDQVLRIELEDFDGEKRYAEYSTFKVASEADGFRLEVSGYSGDAGDALSDPWYGAHGSAFSTHDRDNDRSSLNCASMLKGGWWWKSCGRGLNGLYYDSPQPDSAMARQGIVWFRWKGWDYTLRKATMMIRPKSFRPTPNSSNTI